MPSNYSSDGLHPNDAGYAYMAVGSRAAQCTSSAVSGATEAAARRCRIGAVRRGRVVGSPQLGTLLGRSMRDNSSPDALDDVIRRSSSAFYQRVAGCGGARAPRARPAPTIGRPASSSEHRVTPPDLLLVFPRPSMRIAETTSRDARAHIVLTVRADIAGPARRPGVAAGRRRRSRRNVRAGGAARGARRSGAVRRTGSASPGALTPIDIPVSGFRLHPIVARQRHDGRR